MAQRTKNILLVASFLLLLLAGYRFSIAKTLSLRNEVLRLEQEYEEAKNVAQQGASLRLRERYLDSVLASRKFNGGSLQTNLLEFLNANAGGSGIQIIEFSEPHIFPFENGRSISYRFSLKGDYRSLEDILYTLEQHNSFGEVLSSSFIRERDYRRQVDFLMLTVILRSFDAD